MEIDNRTHRNEDQLRIELKGASPKVATYIIKNLILAVDNSKLSSVKIERITKSKNSVNIFLLLESAIRNISILLAIYNLIKGAKEGKDLKNAFPELNSIMKKNNEEILKALEQIRKSMSNVPSEIQETVITYGSQEPINLTKEDFYSLSNPLPANVEEISRRRKPKPSRSSRFSEIKSLVNTKPEFQTVIDFLNEVNAVSIYDLGEEQVDELIYILRRLK